MKLARPKEAWMTRTIIASRDSSKYTDPVALFDAHDEKVSLGVLLGGGSGGVFCFRFRQVGRSETAENEEEKA